MELSIKYSLLSEILIKKNKEAVYDYVKTTLKLNDQSFEPYKPQINRFITSHDLRWKKKSKFRKNHFEKQYGLWLQQDLVLKPPPPKRDLKPFDQCSRRTQKRRLDGMKQGAEGDIGSSLRTKKIKDAEPVPTN